jgi:3',5'-cyclic AMP phosphodiesterase CpdA
MRIRIFSDLHLEATPFDPPPVPADVVVLAGDIHNGPAGIEWARRAFTQPVVYVAGNHEPFDADFMRPQPRCARRRRTRTSVSSITTRR